MSVAVDLMRRMEWGRSNDSELWFVVVFVCCFFSGGCFGHISLCYPFSLLKHCFLLLVPQLPGSNSSQAFLLNLTASCVAHAAQPLQSRCLAFSRWMMSCLGGIRPRRGFTGSVVCWAASPLLSVWIQTSGGTYSLVYFSGVRDLISILRAVFLALVCMEGVTKCWERQCSTVWYCIWISLGVYSEICNWLNFLPGG